MNWGFKPSCPYFVFDPEGDGITYFKTIEERDAFADECVEAYLEELWNDDVVNVVSGIVTHSAQQTNVIQRPAKLDEEDCDNEGIYWPPDADYICDYQMLPIISSKQINELEKQINELKTHIDNLITVNRFPNIEHVADNHNAAVKALRDLVSK